MRHQLIHLARVMGVTVIEGYSRDELEGVSESIDLCVVPSLWWETYNQVGYEMIMLSVPVLVSGTVWNHHNQQIIRNSYGR